MSVIGLLPFTQLHNHFLVGSLQYKLKFTLKYRREATPPQIVSLKDLPHSENHFFSRTEHANDLANSNHQAAEYKVVDECLALLNQIIRNSDSIYRSSSACKQIHVHLIKLGALKVDDFIGNKLVITYSKSLELLNDACKLFDDIAKKTITAYAALINVFCRMEKWFELLYMFQMMLNDGLLPDQYLIPTTLKACAVMRVGKVAKMIHGYAIRRGLYEDVFVGNALIDVYTNCGVLRLAKSVFDTMRTKDVVTWTALVVAYMSDGLLDEVMQTFFQMELEGVKADLISWNALVSGFAMNGENELAVRMLKDMQRKGLRPQVNTWNGIISGCTQDERYEDALDAFVEMFWTSLSPNAITIVSILPACAVLQDLNLGKAIHGYALKLGHAHVAGSVINMYWKCGRVNDAENIFTRINNKSTFICNEMIAAYMSEGDVSPAFGLFESMKNCSPKPDQVTYNTVLASYFNDDKTKEVDKLLYEMAEMGLPPNVVTFNILISGFQRSGFSHEALRYFQAMQAPLSDTFLSRILKNPIQPNPVNVTCALAACADLSSRQHGKELHGYIVRKELNSNIFVASALIDMYAKCSEIQSAKEIFLRTENRNTVTWNTVIAAYINRRQEYEAFNLFNTMLKEGVEPSPVTYMMLIPACGEIGALSLGREMYGYLLKNQIDESNSYLSYPFVNSSGNSGSIGRAKQELDPNLQVQSNLKNNIIMKYIYNTSFVPITRHPLEPG